MKGQSDKGNIVDLLFIEPCLSQLFMESVVPVRKTILIMFVMCEVLWLLIILPACFGFLRIFARGPRFVMNS